MECKNTEFVWKLRKTGFCESGHTQGCLLLRVSIRRAFTVVSFDTQVSKVLHSFVVSTCTCVQSANCPHFFSYVKQAEVSLPFSCFCLVSNRRSFV